MKKEVWKNTGKVILFLLVICTILIKIFSILNYKSTGGGGGWQNFYAMPKERADVIFFGSSHAHCTFDQGLLWDKYGVAGYTLSAGSQKIDATYYFVKEAIEVQKPKIVVVEVWGAVGEKIVNGDESIYRNTLGMKWGKNHWECVSDLVEHMGGDSAYKKQILLKIPVVHSRYTEVTKDDFKNSELYMRGYRGSFEREVFEKPHIISSEKMTDLDARSEEYLKKIIDIAKENKTALIFVASPYCLSEIEQQRFNKINQIAEEFEVPMIDFNHLYDVIELDFTSDFRDAEHVNNYGAQKVTSYIADFLVTNYNLRSHKGEKGYELWELNSRFLEGKRVENSLLDADGINEYLRLLSELTEYVVILSLDGNHTAVGDVYYSELEKMGINYEDYIRGGAWIFEKGILKYYLPGKEYRYEMKINEIQIVGNISPKILNSLKSYIIKMRKNFKDIENKEKKQEKSSETDVKWREIEQIIDKTEKNGELAKKEIIQELISSIKSGSFECKLDTKEKKTILKRLNKMIEEIDRREEEKRRKQQEEIERKEMQKRSLEQAMTIIQEIVDREYEKGHIKSKASYLISIRNAIKGKDKSIKLGININKETEKELLELIGIRIELEKNEMYFEQVKGFTKGFQFLREYSELVNARRGNSKLDKFTDSESYDRFCRLRELLQKERNEEVGIQNLIESSKVDDTDIRILLARREVIDKENKRKSEIAGMR